MATKRFTKDNCTREKDCGFDTELEVCWRCQPQKQSIIRDNGFLKCTRCGGYEVDETAELCKCCDATTIKVLKAISHVLTWAAIAGLAWYGLF